jgi:arylsulfatase A-like enzyme
LTSFQASGWRHLTAAGTFAWRALCEWSTPLVLVALLVTLWNGATWIADLGDRQSMVEWAVEIAIAIVIAAMLAGVFTLAWIISGGLRTSPTRASRAIAAASTALSTLFLAVVLIFACFNWIAAVAKPVPFPVKIAIILVLAAVLGYRLFAQWHRHRDLDGVSAQIRLPSRRLLLAILPLTLAALWWGGVRLRPYDRSGEKRRPNARARAATPNLLLITFDALAAPDMSLYGYSLPTTPNIDRFAENGMIFERFISASNFTTSSVTSFLTGEGVARHGLFLANSARVADARAEQNVAHELLRQGYVTGAIVTNPYAHPAHIGLGGSFAYLPPPPLRRLPGTNVLYHLTHSDIGLAFADASDGRLRSWASHVNLTSYNATDFPPHLAFDKALTFIAAARQPFFLWIHLLTPHFPYDPPRPFLGRFLAGGEYADGMAYTGSPLHAALKSPDGSQGDYDESGQAEMDKVRLRYDEFVAYADDAFGRFVEKFDALDSSANTVVMVSADHGENFAHGFWGHTDERMWQPTIHVPLVVRLPGRTGAGQRIAGTAGHVDLLPTMLELAGAPVPDWAEGRSLRQMWEGTETAGRRRFSELIKSPNHQPITRGGIAVVEGDETYVLDVASGTGRLSDIAADPLQNTDFSSVRPARAAELRAAALSRIELSAASTS